MFISHYVNKKVQYKIGILNVIIKHLNVDIGDIEMEPIYFFSLQLSLKMLRVSLILIENYDLRLNYGEEKRLVYSVLHIQAVLRHYS